MSPNELSATEAIGAIRSREISVAELCEACLNQIERLEPSLHAWVTWDAASVRRQANKIDAQIAAGAFSGRLWGVPVGVKDIFNTADFPTCMGSPIWSGFTPGNDARVVSHLRWEGGIVVGKTVTAEFAVHHPGPTVNPYGPEHTPGTSSSGSAAAVAAGMVPLAIGTQTAGSTIRPASYCGVYGLKPSFGIVPRTGVLKTLDTLDHVSFLGRSAEDLELLLECCRVRGTNHPYVRDRIDNWAPPRSDRPVVVGLVRGPGWAHAEAYAQQALLDLAREWSAHPAVRLEEVELPAELQHVHELHDLIYSKALSYYFDEECTRHPDLVSDGFLKLVERGRQTSARAYRAGLGQQRRVQHVLEDFLAGFDLLLNLSSAGEGPRGLATPDALDNCLIWTLSHVPAINLPVFMSPSGLPFGAQLVAKRYDDLGLLWRVRKLRDEHLIREWLPPPAGSTDRPKPAVEPRHST